MSSHRAIPAACLQVGDCQYLCINCLLLLALGVVAIGVRTCVSLLRLKSVFGCSRNTRIGQFPALQSVWKHIANSTVQPKYRELEKGQFSAPRVQHCSALFR